jgi:hypothetical protein
MKFLAAIALAGPMFLIFAVFVAFVIKRTQEKGYATKHIISVMHSMRNTRISRSAS